MFVRTLASRPSLLAAAASLFIAGALAGTAGASPEPIPTADLSWTVQPAASTNP